MNETLVKLLGQNTIGQAEVEISPFPSLVNGAIVEINNDNILKEQNIKDREINRIQRERIAKKIFFMMSLELIITAFLVIGIFLVPFINSLSPQITLNSPPIFYTISLLVCYAFIYNKMDCIPNIKIANKHICLKKTEINCKCFLRILLFLFLIFILNYMPRKAYIFTYQTISLDPEIINLVFGASIAIITKTTILGRDIVKTLYELMKLHKFN